MASRTEPKESGVAAPMASAGKAGKSVSQPSGLTGGTDPFLSGEAAPNTVIAMLYLALGPTLVANLLWISGATRLGAARAGSFLYLSPMTSTMLAALFLGERIAWFHLVGFALILFGLYLTNRAADPPQRS